MVSLVVECVWPRPWPFVAAENAAGLVKRGLDDDDMTGKKDPASSLTSSGRLSSGTRPFTDDDDDDGGGGKDVLGTTSLED